MSTIGFVGLGNMGLPMAKNLVGAGHSVNAFDQVESARIEANAAGINICSNNSQTAREADFIVTMLPNGPIVLSVFEEIVPAAQSGTVIIDCSTIDVSSSKNTHKLATEYGLGCLDAPVSGGVGGATAGTLTFMVGGENEAFEKSKPVLDVMGGKTVHCGSGGAGQSAKICNNMLLGISMIGAGEAFALAEKLGLDQKALFDVISTSSGFCWSVNTYCPVPGVGPQSPADNDYQPGFAGALMLKDLLLSQQAADETGAATPMGQKATEFYQQFVDDGFGDKDFSGAIKALKTMERNSQ
ncbi:MAG: 3-hydroxyisobutyrate dehydrogenase [Hyphomicrobiales bacterium]|nr:3-hydroxyisobutyrate dehydrogenase [Hyphomicrobiales bacterium]